MLSLPRLTAFALVALATCVSLLPAEDKKAADTKDGDFKPMFNGKNLDGWVNVNCAPDTFYVKGDEVITTGKPTGFLRTDKQYENFVLEMDWMHVNKKEVANSGLFVWGDPLPGVGTPYTRGIEVQVLINYPKVDWATNHGDIFSIHGAHCKPDRPHPKGYERCLPSEDRVKGGGEWNHYKVTANDGSIKLEVNGKEVSGVSKCTPRKGYLALESEGAECHFKNLKIKELPSTNPKPEEIANVWKGHTSIFNGVDLKGWKTEKDAWKVAGGALRSVDKANLVSEKKYAACELIFDCKLPAKGARNCEISVGGVVFEFTAGGDASFKEAASGRFGAATTGAKFGKAGAWNRVVLTLAPGSVTTTIAGETFDGPKSLKLSPNPVSFTPAEGLEIMNVFVRELKK
jgi:hypothetical protein